MFVFNIGRRDQTLGEPTRNGREGGRGTTMKVKGLQWKFLLLWENESILLVKQTISGQFVSVLFLAARVWCLLSSSSTTTVTLVALTHTPRPVPLPLSHSVSQCLSFFPCIAHCISTLCSRNCCGYLFRCLASGLSELVSAGESCYAFYKSKQRECLFERTSLLKHYHCCCLGGACEQGG